LISSLTYAVTFKQTGRRLAQSLSFGAGLTAITGPNEVGKSFVVEMVRYAFFGSAALRGVGDDYQDLKVSMTFKDYVIDRTAKGGSICRAGEPLAVGTKALNAKVIEILGFGLDVFDMSCVCNQGEVERLGSMPASERKAMVDRVIGAQRIEVVQKWAGEQALLLGREIDVLTRGLRSPVEPVRPEGYADSGSLADEVERLRLAKQEYDQLTGWLANRRAPPVWPARPDIDDDVASLEAERAEAQAAESERARITALPVVDFNVDSVEAHWNLYDHWAERQRIEMNYPPQPTLTQAQVDELEVLLAKEAKVAELRRHRNLLEHGTKARCPECGTEFVLDHEAIKTIDRQLVEIGDFEPSPMSAQALQTQKVRIRTWADADLRRRWEVVKSSTAIELPKITRQALGQAKVGGHVSSLEKQRMLDAVPAPARPVAWLDKLLLALRRYEAELERARAEKKAYDAWAAERDEKASKQQGLAYAVTYLPGAEAKLVAARAYEAARATYVRDLAAAQATQAEIDEKTAEVEGWRSAKTALADVRLKVKTYLVPSLSKVASHLLSQMTDGARSSIVVDENFDIMVDGQRLETLSGSGKACANLALRIGLGQVLTNRVVSLFIGDEIDAAMDAQRASSTHSSIRKLTGQISQILLITHKLPVADTVVQLGELVDERASDFGDGAGGGL
jgi:DNA repair exonuclease SbcCD ATPase subunit